MVDCEKGISDVGVNPGFGTWTLKLNPGAHVDGELVQAALGVHHQLLFSGTTHHLEHLQGLRCVHVGFK